MKLPRGIYSLNSKKQNVGSCYPLSKNNVSTSGTSFNYKMKDLKNLNSLSKLSKEKKIKGKTIQTVVKMGDKNKKKKDNKEKSEILTATNIVVGQEEELKQGDSLKRRKWENDMQASSNIPFSDAVNSVPAHPLTQNILKDVKTRSNVNRIPKQSRTKKNTKTNK